MDLAQPSKQDNNLIDLSIIIVSWNVRDLLDACLASIGGTQGQLNLEIIVVDSASIDGSPAMVEQLYPSVKLIQRPDNVGFPKGNNIGMQEAQGRYLLLLNPDTEIIGDALTDMVHFLDENEDVGLVGPLLRNPDGSVQSSRRRFPTLAIGVFESTWLESFMPRGLRQNYFAEDLAIDQVVDVDWLTGACMMTRRQVVNKIGDMDEAYFMYSEELDWCRRIKSAGWRIIFLPSAEVVHHVGKSSEQAVVERHINFQRAKLRYFRKYHGPVAAGVLRAILLMNYGWQLVLEALKGILGHKRLLRWQRVQAYWQVLRSGLPPAGY